MRILFAASEVYPYSKTGGLGDVVGALPAAVAALGHEVLVVSPWYATLRGQPQPIDEIEFPAAGGKRTAGIGILEQAGTALAFVRAEEFERDSIYGYADDVRRFCLLTRAVPWVAARLGFAPDVIHVHDWHAAYLPALLRHASDLPPGFPGLPSVLTIHNAQYQGVSELSEALGWLGLPFEAADPWIRHFGDANALNAGIGYADRVTTVSPTYARELLTSEYGYGLEGSLLQVRHKLSGILNGIDTDVWDPANDPLLPAAYDATDLGGKEQAKRMLAERFGLEASRPLLGVVSRLADQKGIDILLAAVPQLYEQGWSLLLLGSGDERLEAKARELSDRGLLAVHLGFDEALAHLIYAGSDAIGIPSRFEPCGLSQLIAMRYGSLPLARATGGLIDTIRHGRTGFLFEEFEPRALVTAAEEARRCYRTRRWERMVEEAMAQDFSWARSARQYLDVYREAGSNLQ